MTTLDDLLALLPDNSTGDISAADMRTITTELWGYTEAVEARVAALETGGGTIQMAATYQATTQANATPANSQAMCDTGDWTACAYLNVSERDLMDVDRGPAMQQATNIYVQQESNADVWVRYQVSGPPVINTGWQRFPVTITASAGVNLPLTGAAIFVFARPA